MITETAVHSYKPGERVFASMGSSHAPRVEGT